MLASTGSEFVFVLESESLTAEAGIMTTSSIPDELEAMRKGDMVISSDEA